MKKKQLALALLAATPFYSLADANQPTEVIVVTANNFAQTIEQSLATVTVIDRSSIDQLNARDLPTLLSQVAGVDLVRNGGFGQKADLFVRGATAKHTLVLINGVRVGDANSGSTALTNLPVNAIERIEFIRGARAAVYGSDAVAGVINIITRDNNDSSFSATQGSHHYSNWQANSAWQGEQLRASFNAGYEKTNGYDVTEKPNWQAEDKDNDADGYLNKNLGLKLSYNANGHVFNYDHQLSFGHAEYDNAWGNDAHRFRQQTDQLSWQYQQQDWHHSAALSTGKDESVQYGSAFEETFNTERKEWRLQTRYQASTDWQWLAGANWQQEDVAKTTQLATLSKRHNVAAYLGGFYQQGDWLANGTVRVDDNQHYGRQTTYNVAAGYQLNDEWLLRFSQGTGFKAPTFSQLYGPTSTWTASNPDLQPETNLNRELAAQYNFTQGELTLVWFNNDIEQLITSKYLDGKYVPQNIDQANYRGVELTLTAQVGQFSHRFNATKLRARDEKTGDALPRRPEHAVNYRLTHHWQQADLTLNVQYRSDRPTIVYYDDTIDGYTTVDVSANYYFANGLTAFVRLENLTDESYSGAALAKDDDGQLYFYLAPPRQGFVGLRYQF